MPQSIAETRHVPVACCGAQDLDWVNAAVDRRVCLVASDGPAVAWRHLVGAGCQRQVALFVHLDAQSRRHAEDGGGFGEELSLTHIWFAALELAAFCPAAGASL